MDSIKTIARIGGLLYLVNIVFGFFAIGYVPGVIEVAGNPSVTAHNIIIHEQLYRLGLVAHIIILLTNIPLAVIFYEVFKVVNRRTALLVVFFSIVGTAVEAVNLLLEFAPLLLLKGNNLTAFTPEQLELLVYKLNQLQGIGFNLALVFFGFYCISVGYLVFKSTFLPKVVGVMMVIGGLCYLINSFTSFLAPQFAGNLFPYYTTSIGTCRANILYMPVNYGSKVVKLEAVKKCVSKQDCFGLTIYIILIIFFIGRY